MLQHKRYLQILFLILGIILTSTMGYAYYFSKTYPLPFTNRISFDAKIKFIREHIDVNKIDTIVVGSSIGLNDVQGAYLEKTSKVCNHVLNLSVFEASPVQVEQLLMLENAFPNLKRIVYSAQFSDFQHASSFRDYHPKWISKYIAHKFTPVVEAKFLADAAKNITFLEKREEKWKKEHLQSNKFTYLGFDHTGSVPLHIFEKDTYNNPFNAKRWNNPHGSLYVAKAFEALDRISKDAYKKGIKFYMVQQPYRQALIKKYKHIPMELNMFLHRITKIVTKNHGKVLSLYKTLPLDDRYFADRSHLNEKGSKLSAEAIGRFIDKQEK